VNTVKTILIADDSNLVMKLLSNKLTKAGYNILTGADGKEALTHLDGKTIDLLITDLNMPAMDGLTLISTVRSNEHYQYMPVVLFISDEIADKRSFIRESGATIGFDKSGVQKKLLPVVKRMIG
jgi:two-component system, chemotaxis family, chemotaxis protein CheY